MSYPRLSVIAAACLALYSVLALLVVAVWGRHDLAYTSSFLLQDALVVVATTVICAGLLGGKAWARYLALAWTGLRLAWRGLVLGGAFQFSKPANSPAHEGPHFMALLRLALLITTLACLIRLETPAHQPAAP
jgi:hypothetical protein